jgi:outer membrane immunogenic protein
MKSIILSMIAALAASSAMAADLASPSIAPVKTMWSGPEFGLFGGGDWLNADGTLFTSPSQSFDGGHFGGFAGYQYQFDNDVVLGIEGDVNYDWNQKTLYDSAGNPADIGTDLGGSVRARVGYAFDKFLLYATGGWVITRSYVDPTGSAAEHNNFNGYTIGAGVDYAFTDQFFVRAEYRYNNFEDKTFSGGLDADLDQQLLNVGIGVKF